MTCYDCHKEIVTDFDFQALFNAEGKPIVICHRCIRKRSSQDWRPGKTEKDEPGTENSGA